MCKVTATVVETICQQSVHLDYFSVAQQNSAKSEVLKKKRDAQSAEARRLHPLLPQKHQKLLAMVSERGSSSWLVALLLECHGFSLQKGAFRDNHFLRYGWQPSNLPSKCACGKSLNEEHVFTCPTRGFQTVHHDEIRDVIASLHFKPSQVNSSPTLQQIGKTVQDWISKREDSGEYHSVLSMISGFSAQTQN